MAQTESSPARTQSRSIRPRPIDVDLAMPVVHFKTGNVTPRATSSYTLSKTFPTKPLQVLPPKSQPQLP
jgi:hypothetical protein